MKSIEWVILITENFHDMQGFYTDTLELPVARVVPEEEFVQFKLDNCFLALYGKQFAEKLVPITGKPGGVIYSFGESENIDVEYQQLRAKGVQFIKEPQTQPWGQKTAYFTDPDGNIWEIQQWVKK